MSSYYSADASRNSSASRSMWGPAAVNSDSGSDNDFTKGKKRNPADNLLERIQKRLQNENFYDLSTSDQTGTPSPGHLADASGSYHGRPQAYMSQDSSSMMRSQSGIVVPQAPSPPIISMQEENAQPFSYATRANYPAQEAYKSDSRSQRQLGSHPYDYKSLGGHKQEASTRFGPPAKKPRTETNLNSTEGSSCPPSLSDFLADNFGVHDDLPLSYGRTQRTASEKHAMLSEAVEYLSSKKSKFSSVDGDGQSVTSASGYYSRDSAMMSAPSVSNSDDQRRNSQHGDNRSPGMGISVPSRARGGFNDGDPHSSSRGLTLEDAHSSMAHQQSSQNRQSFHQEFQRSSSRSKSSLDPNFSSHKLTSSENKESSNTWAGKESSFQGGRQFLSSSGRFGQSEDLSKSDNYSSDMYRNGSSGRTDAFSGEIHEGSRASFRTGVRGSDKPHSTFRAGSDDAESLFQNNRGASSGNIGGQGELRSSYGSGGSSSMENRESYRRGAFSSDSRGSFRGGRGDSRTSYRATIADRGDSRGSFTGGQGDSSEGYHGISSERGDSRASFASSQGDNSDSYRDFSGSRVNSRGSFTGDRGDSSDSYRGISRGRGNDSRGSFRGARGESSDSYHGISGGRGGGSRGSFRGGRGEPGGSYRGIGGGRGGDSRGSFRGGRGESSDKYRGGSIGRGSGMGAYGGIHAGRGDSRGSFRGGRGVVTLSPRGGMRSDSTRGTRVSRGSSLERSAARGRLGSAPNFQKERSDGKENRFSAPDDITKSGFIVVDSYKSSTSVLEDFSSLPKEALQCSVCKIISFQSAITFKEHLDSQHHAHMLTLLSTRNDCLEQFIKSGAKLASRAVEHEVMSNSGCAQNEPKGQESEFIMCNYCDCTVLRSAVSMHNQLIQHKELMEFSKPLCCGIKFTKRQAYEVHRATNKHLSSKHEFEKLFIANAVLSIEKEALKSIGKNVPENFVVKSLSLTQPEYVIKILQSLEKNPVIESENEDYCLACEVSIPRFRKSFHPCCSDHHANTVVFCSKNKIRLTARITQYLKEVRDSGAEAPDTAAVKPSSSCSTDASAKSVASPSIKPTTKSPARAAASSGPQTRASTRTAIKRSSPASTKDTVSLVKKPPQLACEEKPKIEKTLTEDDESDGIDDEFDYEFSSVNIDDMKQEPVKDGASEKPITKERDGTQDSEEQCVDDEFAYVYDASLCSSDAKLCDKKPVVTSVTSKLSEKKKVEVLEDEDNEVDDFEYDYAPNIEDDSKTQNEDDKISENVVSQQKKFKKQEEKEIDEFDYQFESAEESHDHSLKKLGTTEVVADDEADDINSASNETKKRLVDQHSSQEADDDDDEEEFDYELADNDSLAVKDSNGDNLNDDAEFEYDMEVPESEEALEEEDGFEYDLVPESPKETKVCEDINGNENSDGELSAFDYEMQNEETLMDENIKKDDPPASNFKNAENTSEIANKKSDDKEMVGASDVKAEKGERVKEKILQDQKTYRDVEEEAGEDARPTKETSENKIEIKVKSDIKEESSVSGGHVGVKEEKDIPVSDTEKLDNDQEEEEITVMSSLKRKRLQKDSGSDKSSESVPKSTLEGSARPKRRSIAPIRFN
ncbi:hypothetical protein FHG87_021050 [Trinorchestia longiramus]|nr:hypothetical protein FHG87_021050 [Trinorchestia longiramus]